MSDNLPCFLFKMSLKSSRSVILSFISLISVGKKYELYNDNNVKNQIKIFIKFNKRNLKRMDINVFQQSNYTIDKSLIPSFCLTIDFISILFFLLMVCCTSS